MNGVECNYEYTDPFKKLFPHGSHSYSGEELDLTYRAALEISRVGELAVTIPDLSKGRTEKAKPIPRSSPKDVLSRYEKLLHAYSNLSTNSREDDGADRNFIQILIKYRSTADAKKFPMGYVFRKSPQWIDSFEGRITFLKAKTDSAESVIDTLLLQDEPAQCAYTVNHTGGSLRDIDGVRCWVPCIDSLDQRQVFDISITTPRSFRILCVGKRLSSVKAESSIKKIKTNGEMSQKLIPRKITRFFTPDRISAMSVGFFIGHVETYKMSLYKVRSRFWVAKGLADFCGRGHIQWRRQKEQEIDEKKKRQQAALVAKKKDAKLPPTGDSEFNQNTLSSGIAGIPRKITSSERTEDTQRVVKRPRADSNLDDDPYAVNDDQPIVKNLNRGAVESESLQKAEMIKSTTEDTKVNPLLPPTLAVPTNSFYSSGQQIGAAIQMIPELMGYGMEKASSRSRKRKLPSDSPKPKLEPPLEEIDVVEAASLRRLYHLLVHHSTLGIDMALRHIHKFIGRKFNYEEMTFVFIPNLGEVSMSYDGFALLDASLLHNEE